MRESTSWRRRQKRDCLKYCISFVMHGRRLQSGSNKLYGSDQIRHGIAMEFYPAFQRLYPMSFRLFQEIAAGISKV